MVDVFISYSRANQETVRLLARALQGLGYSLWWDDELPPHRSYSEVITEKIGEAKAAIVVWSGGSIGSEWVRAEADLARNQKKLIQTAIDDCMPPMPFNQIQFASLAGWQGEDDHPGWTRVKGSLAALCGAASDSRPVYPLPKAPPPASPRRSNRLLVAAIGGSLVVLLGVGALALIRGGGTSAPAPAPAPTVAATPALVPKPVAPPPAAPATHAARSAPATAAPAPRQTPTQARQAPQRRQAAMPMRARPYRMVRPMMRRPYRR